MNMYGGIPVIGESEFVVGTVLEIQEQCIIARTYFQRKNGSTGIAPGDYRMNHTEINEKSTVEEKIKEIVRQLETEDFYIREDVVKLL